MHWIIIVSIVITSIFLFFYLVVRWCVTFNTKYNNEVATQQMEVIPDKFVIFQSGRKVFFKFVQHEQTTTIVLCVTDLYGTVHDFDNLISANPHYDFFVLGRRNRVEHFQHRTIACDRDDIWALQTWLQKKYPHKNIILLLEGFACGWAPWFAKKRQAWQQIIMVNPITNKKAVRFKWKMKMKILFCFLFSWNHRVVFMMQKQLLFAPSKSPALRQKTQPLASHQKIAFDYLLVWFQYYWINRAIVLKTKHLFDRQQKMPIKWYQSANSMLKDQKLLKQFQKYHLATTKYFIVKSSFQYNISFLF